MSEVSRTFKLVTLWLVIGVAVFLGVEWWQAEQQRSRFSSQGGVVELRRGPDGHFHWPGRVNGIAVDFLVDTGATSTALPQSLAEEARLVMEGSVTSSTAGGVVRGSVARADIELQGGVSAERLRVTVLPALEAPLLGMDVLSKMHFSQRGGVLRFEPPSP
ncbi:retroviral-like aspartic protease family protein [Aquincola tertiaricarbonis]|uniref:Retroviral-like aspartic protease family protein n=1 Tax=Aquincola tertiaricarbonis TaxID=391953 RepID=A0ABY4SG78_AQUTE|nr:retropepsin-like aspartic protease [Aquincola tertiaricarbonis]URI10011.1 retroviral-like aspartic protease family protein [Aquincola tertiaricarbonis]